MASDRVMKGLVFPALLFWCWSSSAQSVLIEKPGRNEPLSDTQAFVISSFGGQPSRMDFYLNGRLILARREPPWTFDVRWNTRYENTVKIVAHFDDGEPVVVTRTFEEIAVDVEEEVAVFQFFPFVEIPPGDEGLTVVSRGRTIVPQKVTPAFQIPLELIIALDTSGSMMFSFDQLDGPIRHLIRWARERNYPTRFLIFDRSPSLIDIDTLPDNLKALYRERPSSVMWDTIATAASMFEDSPRRVVMVITDGGDQGSKHTAETAGTYLRKSGAALIWVSPANLRNEELGELAIDSGGFVAYTRGRDPWPGILYLLDRQHHVLAPEAGYPVELKIEKGRVWYPRWQN